MEQPDTQLPEEQIQVTFDAVEAPIGGVIIQNFRILMAANPTDARRHFHHNPSDFKGYHIVMIANTGVPRIVDGTLVPADCYNVALKPCNPRMSHLGPECVLCQTNVAKWDFD